MAGSFASTGACAREAPQPADSCALALSALQCSLPGGEGEDTGHRAFRAPARLPLLSAQLGSPFLLSELGEHVSSRFLLTAQPSPACFLSFFLLPACLTEFRLDKT